MKNFSNRKPNPRNSGSGRPEMFATTCSSCGKDCEVPFKPTGSKPVLCSECFETKGEPRRDNRKPRSGSRDQVSRTEFEILNKKLDKILHLITTTISMKFDDVIEKPKLSKEEMDRVIEKHRENKKEGIEKQSSQDEGA